MPGKNLTRDEARERADLLSVATSTSPSTSRPDPPPSGPGQPSTSRPFREGAGTFIDLIAASVEQITLNGESLDPATHFDGVRVQLPALRSGANELTIDATGAYMNTGEGLHRFVDPVDDEVYLYTQFEVADCRRMFAVFEQPDLKATFAFTVTAPRTGRSSPAGRPRADHRGNRRGAGVPSATGGSRPHRGSLLHHRADRRRRTTWCTDRQTSPASGAYRSRHPAPRVAPAASGGRR